MSEQNRDGWTELHGASWLIDPGWQIIHELDDIATGLLGVITKHTGRGLLKADLFALREAETWPSPRWESVGCIEALFGPSDFEEAVRYLQAAICNRTPHDPRP